MVISEQFKFAQFEPKKMRKLCTDEIGEVKMKKNERKRRTSLTSVRH
jgi:hypothetical protein